MNEMDPAFRRHRALCLLAAITAISVSFGLATLPRLWEAWLYQRVQLSDIGTTDDLPAWAARWNGKRTVLEGMVPASQAGADDVRQFDLVDSIDSRGMVPLGHRKVYVVVQQAPGIHLPSEPYVRVYGTLHIDPRNQARPIRLSAERVDPLVVRHEDRAAEHR